MHAYDRFRPKLEFFIFFVFRVFLDFDIFTEYYSVSSTTMSASAWLRQNNNIFFRNVHFTRYIIIIWEKMRLRQCYIYQTVSLLLFFYSCETCFLMENHDENIEQHWKNRKMQSTIYNNRTYTKRIKMKYIYMQNNDTHSHMDI